MLALSLLAILPIDVVGAQAPSVTIVQAARSSESNVAGPAELGSANFNAPTTPGNLLVAAVLCGIVTAGMKVPTLSLPTGWHLGAARSGGIKDGLKAAVYYYPDNPGGISDVALDAKHRTSVLAGSDAWCTTFLWEVSGMPPTVVRDTFGSKSVIQNANPATRSITVTSTNPTRADDLVLLAETDGSEVNVDSGLYQVSPPFTLASQWDNGTVAQPGTLSYEIAPNAAVQSGTITQGSNWFDSCAVMVALAT